MEKWVVFRPFFHPMLNRQPIVIYKLRSIFGFKEKRNSFADNYIFFVWSEESSEYLSLGLVIRFDIFIFFWNMTREERIGSLH